jgi:hypothetical protein
MTIMVPRYVVRNGLAGRLPRGSDAVFGRPSGGSLGFFLLADGFGGRAYTIIAHVSSNPFKSSGLLE